MLYEVITETDIVVGSTEEGQSFDLGWFDPESEIVFWSQGRNKRFYTGKGNATTTHDQFVINGVKFQIYIEKEILKWLEFLEL